MDIYYSKSKINNQSTVIYTYTVSRVTYTDEYSACIWMSLGEFRYERYENQLECPLCAYRSSQVHSLVKLMTLKWVVTELVWHSTSSD